MKKYEHIFVYEWDEVIKHQEEGYKLICVSAFVKKASGAAQPYYFMEKEVTEMHLIREDEF